MAIAVKGHQNIRRVTYRSEEISRRGNICYKMIFGFYNQTSTEIKDIIPVGYMRHLIQQAIYLNNRTGPDIGYSDYQITRSKYHLQMKFYKYSSFYPMAAGDKQNRYEEVNSDDFVFS